MNFENVKVVKNTHLPETVEQALLLLDDYLDGKTIAMVYEENEFIFVAHGFLVEPIRIDIEPYTQVMYVIQELDSNDGYHRHVNRIVEELGHESRNGIEVGPINGYGALVDVVKYVCIAVVLITLFVSA